MITRVTTSTICYNTPQFLKMKCDELISEGQIDFYCFVPHKKESDELKDHIHRDISIFNKVNSFTIM